MLFEPFCFIRFIESNGNTAIISYIDNWAEGAPSYYFFDDLVIDMQHCIHIDVAGEYLRKINEAHLIRRLKTLDCPCEQRVRLL
jgi:hypothetical protein